MTFDSDTEAIDLITEHKWTKVGKYTFFSPTSYGECTQEEKDAIIYLLDEHGFNYGGQL